MVIYLGPNSFGVPAGLLDNDRLGRALEALAPVAGTGDVLVDPALPVEELVEGVLLPAVPHMGVDCAPRRGEWCRISVAMVAEQHGCHR